MNNKLFLKETRDCLDKLNLITDPVVLEMSFVDAFVLICQLQLALRCPGNNSESARLTKEMCQKLQTGLASRVPEAFAVLERGWHSEFDIEPSLELSSLDPNIKRELLTNSAALQVACTYLAASQRVPVKNVMEALIIEARKTINKLSPEQVNQAIASIDARRNPPDEF